MGARMRHNFEQELYDISLPREANSLNLIEEMTPLGKVDPLF
jgi:hypothetical protein